MHLSNSKDTFKLLSKLFMKKWKKHEKEFVEYFESTWLQSHCNWYESAAIYTPSTNNNLEGYNGVIKRTITFRERLPFGQFVLTVFEMASGLSVEYRKNERVMQELPVISINDWRDAAIWANDEKRRHISTHNMVFIVPSSKALNEEWDLTKANVEKLQKTKFRDFDQYVKFGIGFYWTVNLSQTQWQMFSSCDCPHFLKNFMCKHVIGVALRNKICKLPRAAIPTAIGEKRKRGKPAQAKKALLTQ